MNQKIRTKLNGYCIVLILLWSLQAELLKAQMVGPNAYIKATSLEIGLDGLGGFEGADTFVSPYFPSMHYRSGTQYFGFVANPQINLWTTFDGDFFTPGTPENGWGIEIGTTGGVIAGNNCTQEFNIPGAITSWTHTFDCYSADWQGDLTSGTDLHFKINYFLQETDLYYTTTVSITNNTSATIPDLYYYRNLDPDNNQSISGDFTTQNTIISQPAGSCGLAHVKATSSLPGSQPLSYLGLAAIGSEFRVCYGGFSNRDASDLWTGAGGFTQTVGATNFADEAIALSYRIQNLAPGATETFKFVIILDDASATSAINNLLYVTYPGSSSAPPSVCTPFVDTARTCGGPISVGVSGSTVADFTWSWSPGTGLSSTTGPTVIANPPTTTTYTITGTPIGGCFAPVTLNIVVQVTPSAGADPIIAAIPPQCISGPPITLIADTTGGLWSGTGITNASLGTFNPTTAGIGTFMITYITPGICNTTDTAMVTVSSAANATITPVPPVCVGASSFNLTSATGGGVWSGTGITDTLNGTFNPALAGVGSYTITYDIPSGTCSATDTVIVNVVALFDATITPHSSVCQGTSPFNLTAATSGGTWTGTGITSASAGTFNPALAGSSIVVTYTISGSCGNTDTVHLNVIANAVATITPVNAVCVNAAAFNLTAANPGGTWSGTGITSTSAGTFNPATSGSGIFTITYSISGMCGDTATTLVTVNALPTPGFTSDVVSGCVPTCVQFNESVSTSCTSLIYDFGDGNTATSSTLPHCYTTVGIYSVGITCTDANNCTGSTTVSNMITIYPIPVANFTISPSGIVYPNTDVTFNDISTGGTSSFWTFDDPSSINNTSFLTSPTHSYASDGDYCVTLVSTNSGGCKDTLKSCLLVIGDATILIPNVFTPNNDLDNDSFYVTTTGVQTVKCDIYDRWGLKIVTFEGVPETDGTTTLWDGRTKKGALSSDGTYYYILTVAAINKKSTQKEGFIQLLRNK